MEYSIIWSKLRKGDENALKQLFENLYEPLCNFSLQYTMDEDSSQDIVQGVFVDLWEKKDKIVITQSIKSYLYRAVYNSFIDMTRHQKRKDKAFDLLKYKTLTQENEDETIYHEKLKKLQQEIETLPPKCQEILLLSKRDGMKYKEIANTLDISVKTVESQMRKAYLKIREAFEDDDLFLFLLFKAYQKQVFALSQCSQYTL